MDPAPGARSFRTSGDAYDRFMGRYSRALAVQFADVVEVGSDGDAGSACDVGCGPGALTAELARRLGPERVAACDPSEPFVADCAARLPGVDVRLGRAEAIPFEDSRFDRALAQLVLHFVSDPTQAAAEMRRIVRPNGIVAACVWDVDAGMQMLRAFWDAAVAVVPDAPDEARTLRFGREREIADLFAAAGLVDVRESTLTVSSEYADLDELWGGFLAGIGPAGSWLLSLDDRRREDVRAALDDRLGSPTGAVHAVRRPRGARERSAPADRTAECGP